MEEIILKSELSKEEKQYWIDLLPVMTIEQKEKLWAILTKSINVLEFNRNFLINYSE